MVASNNKSIFIHGSSVRKSKIKALVGLAPSKVFWEVAFFFFLRCCFFLHLFVFCFFQLLPGFPGLWPHLSSLCLHLHVAFSAMCVSESCFSHGIQPLTSLPLTQAVIILFSFLPPALPPLLPSSKRIYHVSSFVLGDHQQPKQAESALWKLIALW